MCAVELCRDIEIWRYRQYRYYRYRTGISILDISFFRYFDFVSVRSERLGVYIILLKFFPTRQIII